jgi:hypothetical protein
MPIPEAVFKKSVNRTCFYHIGSHITYAVGMNIDAFNTEGFIHSGSY